MYLEAFGMAWDVEVVNGDLGVVSYETSTICAGGHTFSADPKEKKKQEKNSI